MVEFFKSKYTKIVIIILLALAGFFVLAQILMNDRVLYGATIGDLNLSGLKTGQAKMLLDEKMAQYLKTRITILAKEKTLEKTPEELGVKFDSEKTIAKLSGPWQKRFVLTAQIDFLISDKEELLEFSVDKEKFDDFFGAISEISEEPPKDAFFTYDTENKELIINEGKDGIAVEEKKFKSDLNNDLGNFKNETVILEFNKKNPEVNSTDLKTVETEAQSLAAKAPFVLKAGDWRGNVDAPTLSAWLIASPVDNGFKLDIDKEKLNDFLKNLLPQINQKPINAKLAWDGGKVTAFSLSQNGREVKLDLSAQKIYNGILAGQKEIKLAYEVIEPRIATESLNMLGLTTLLGRGESNFSGSPANRKHNIAVGAAKLNGLLVEPGAEFSFIDNIGEINGTTGYLLGLVLKPGKMTEEYGGGICQVSTTVFRAAVNSGLKITARSPHAIPVAYYNPQGFDATIYPPKPDLKFINDTQNKILIQTKIIGTKLIFEIYGTPDGRQVKVIGPKTLVANADGSMKTILTQQIWRDGTLQKEDIFRSSYKSPSLYPITNSSPTPTPSATPMPTPTESSSSSPIPSENATPSPSASLSL